MRRGPGSALLLILAVASSGCSFAFMQKAPSPVPAPNYPLDCTDSIAAPVLDTICAGYFVLNTIVLAALPNCAQASFGQTCVNDSQRGGGILLSVGLGILCAAAAGSGYGVASRCSQAKGLNALCITGDGAACRTLRGDWSGSAAPRPAAPAVDVFGGCAKDTDCKGARICRAGACVDPPAPLERP